MRLTRDVLGAVVLGLAAVGAASAANDSNASASRAAQHRNEAKVTEHLSTSGSLTFAPGDLAEGVTMSLELSHGFELMEDLATLPGGGADTDEYKVSAKPQSSYEAVVDSTSGDIGPTLAVERVVAGGTTVLQSSQAVGVGFTRSLRWINSTAVQNDLEAIRVRSGQCTTNCGPDDVYFIRGYETTYSIPRFNNFASQITVLLLQNPTNYTIAGFIYFWDPNGVLVATQPFSLAGKQLQVLNTATVSGANGIGGSVTIAHDGRYGDLSAKTVALEPATGFSFDSPALPRLR
jgi:hypothetical protein